MSCKFVFNPFTGQLDAVTRVANRVCTVDTFGDLPTGVPEGSICYVKDTDTLYIYDGTNWNDLSSSVNVPTYTTIGVDQGTSPVATTNGETLTLTSSDSSILITGDAGTDTVDLTVSSSSPGFTWTRAGNVTTGTWLQVGVAPSNQASHVVDIDNPKIKKITVATTNTSTFDIEFYDRVGATFNLLHTVSVTGARKAEFDVNVTLTKGRELAVKLSSGSAFGLVVDAQLTGGGV